MFVTVSDHGVELPSDMIDIILCLAAQIDFIPWTDFILRKIFRVVENMAILAVCLPHNI